ncbi:MAG: riboflavin synthase [Candidatus Marinimicrobia bacterium]|nr:riboflavin synthase [Candidatus Neomarinimicrobiota bacterium]
MFTGIIEEMGTVVSRTPADGTEELVIEAKEVLGDLKVGHSISVNGVCLTAVAVQGHDFTVQVIPETLDRTSLGNVTPGEKVNLERALSAMDRFHGHVVQGHVETVGVISQITQSGGDIRMRVMIDREWLRYCIPKGSVTLNGVSLTIADISISDIIVALIPHTLDMTNLGLKEMGDQVNVETDIFARYFERFLEFDLDDDPQLPDVSRFPRWGVGES